MPPPVAIVTVLAFLLGLLLGSFLNVCIARLPLDESVISPRSHCRSCGKTISWYGNVPLISYFVLRARCGGCGSTISARYPLVELATGFWFAVSFVAPARLLTQYLAQGGNADLLLRTFVHHAGDAALGFFLIGLLVIDWEHQLLPNELTLTGAVAGIFFACAEAIFLTGSEDSVVLQHGLNITAAGSGRSPGNVFLTGPEHLIFGRLAAAAAAFLLLYLIRMLYRAVRKRDGMGLGDAKLLALIASFLGFAPTGVALAMGILLATVYATFLLLRRHAGATTRLPFGSFLAAGGLVAALTGTRLVDWYTSLFR